jgi:MFS family permease
VECVVNVLFPFMAFMVEDLGYGGAQLGYYVGLLAAAFCTAQFFSSVFWGKMSDIYGRKPSIIIGTAGTVAGMLMFGLAKSYTQAIVGRFLAGLLSGNIGVLKTYVTEITDDSNRATGFSYTSLAWAAGCIVAPLFGGMLSNPADKFPNYFSQHGIFGVFPYFLPILLCVIFLLVSILFCILFMKETNPKLVSAAGSKAVKEIEMTKTDAVVSPVHTTSNDADDDGCVTIEFNSTPGAGDDDDTGVSINNGSRSTDDGHRSAGDSNDKNSVQDDDDSGSDDDEECFLCVATCFVNGGANKFSAVPTQGAPDGSMDRSSHSLIHSNSEMGNAARADADLESAKKSRKRKSNPLTQRLVLLASANYTMLCMGFIIFDETLPLYLKLDVSNGGFSFSSLDIGWLLSAGGVFLMIFAGTIMPKIGRHSKKAVFHYALLVLVAHCLLWPLAGALNAQLLTQYSSRVAEMLMYPFLFVLLCIKASMGSCSFMASTIQVNHSVYSEDLGIVNGFAQALAALARGIGPALGGVLWSASTAWGFVYLNFIVAALMWGINMCVNGMLPLSLDTKKQKKSKKLKDSSKLLRNDSNEEEEVVHVEF